MQRRSVITIICIFVLFTTPLSMKLFAFGKDPAEVVSLPPPVLESDTSVEEALAARRSVRDYGSGALTLAEIAQLLWAAQGKTHHLGLRTAPSPGALYPLEIFMVVGQVDGLAPGVYRYRSHEHDLLKTLDGDRRIDLYKASLEQESIRDAPAVIVITAVYARATKKYRERGEQYTHIEVGAAAENIYLQAETLGLGTVIMGAFYDDKVSRALSLEADETPLAILPVGRRR